MVRFILLVCLAIYAQANFLGVPHLPVHLHVAHRAPYGPHIHVPPPNPGGPYAQHLHVPPSAPRGPYAHLHVPPPAPRGPYAHLHVPPPAPRGPYGLPPPSYPVHNLRAGRQADAQVDSDDYCSQNPQHTMCQFTGPDPICMASTASRRLNPDTITAVLDRHNQLRTQVAQGNQPGQPPAANMNQLVWNTELADTAQRWADQCNGAVHDGPNDRNKLDGSAVGQNIGTATNWPTQLTDGQLTNVALDQVQNWFDEVSSFNPNSVRNYVFDPDTGHYSQMVWAATREVGCGSVYYQEQEGDDWRYTLVCNYASAGNVRGSAVYEVGPACSECGRDGCENGLNGLCL